MSWDRLFENTIGRRKSDIMDFWRRALEEAREQFAESQRLQRQAEAREPIQVSWKEYGF